jgi:hypothetical protein
MVEQLRGANITDGSVHNIMHIMHIESLLGHKFATRPVMWRSKWKHLAGSVWNAQYSIESHFTWFVLWIYQSNFSPSRHCHQQE